MTDAEIQTHPPTALGFIDRILRPFTEVRAGEGPTALLLMCDVFLLMAVSYVVKPLREGLILAEPGGAETKSYMAGVIALLLVFLVPAYAKLVNRFIRARLITLVTGFFIGCLVLFWGLQRAGVPRLGVAFFVWVGIFNVMVVAQFWGFANDVYDSDAGKRLFPIVNFGATAGAVAGPWLVGQLLKLLDPFRIMLVAAALLVVCIALTRLVSGRKFRPQAPPASPVAPASGGFFDGLDLLVKHRYLGLIAALVLLLNLVNTTGEYVLGRLVRDHAQTRTAELVREAERAGRPLVVGDASGDPKDEKLQKAQVGKLIGSFYADFFGWVNLLAMLFQLFLASRLVKYGGVRAALFMLPLIALGTYSLAAFLPALAWVRIAKIFENATDYSVNNTARHMLFLPTSTEIKYKAKQATDSFMQRAGDVASAAVVALGNEVLGLSVRQFALANLCFIGAWPAIVILIARDFRRLETGAYPEIAAAPAAS